MTLSSQIKQQAQRIADLEEALTRLNEMVYERSFSHRLSSSKVFERDYLGKVKGERKIKTKKSPLV